MSFRYLLLGVVALTSSSLAESRYRCRQLGIEVGVLPPGQWNSITDVSGVLVGQVTLNRGQDVRTGVTAILPHGGNLFLEKVPAAVYVGNGFGKLTGSSQVEELGNLETPILLTNTLNVPRVADAVIDYMLALPAMEEVRSINPLVGETNDGYLNNIRLRVVGQDEVFESIRGASSGPVQEGAVGAGTGTICFGFKGGIGTSSRVLGSAQGGYTVGVLVQTNFGGILQVLGAPVGRELGRYYLNPKPESPRSSSPDGSCMVIVATDAPLDSRNLKRLAKRAMLGLAATGSSSSNGSGDYVIAFSTAPDLRVPYRSQGATAGERRVGAPTLANDDLSPLFQAVKESTEEAVYNSLFMAESVTGQKGRRIEAIPLEPVVKVLQKHGILGADFSLPGTTSPPEENRRP